MCQTLQTKSTNANFFKSSQQNSFQVLKNFVFLITLLLSVLISNIANSQCTCTGNLVLNPSFESGTANWGWSGGTLSAGNGAVKCGSFSGDFQITNNSSNWVSQTIASGTISAGSTITASVYAGTHDASFYSEVSIMYFTSSWVWISNTAIEVNKVLANSPAGPQLYTLTGVVPAGTYYVQVGFGGNGNWIKTDMWCATVTSTCNNVTSGGTIGTDETFCGSTFNPSNITNITLPAGGNSNAIQYLWLGSYDGGTTDFVISGATSSTYDPPSITQSTWYRRCARRAGCTSYDGESNWVMKELTTCCTAAINGLIFKDPSGVNTSTIAITNGGTYNIPSLMSPFNVEALLTGNMESVRLTLTGSASSTNTENTVPWDLGGTASTNVWPNGAGTFTMLIEAFPQDNAVGAICATSTITFTLTNNVCNNLTSGGTIGNDESICGTSLNPANIINVTLPSGGNTNTIEYLWLISTDGGTTNSVIAGATNSTYDPGVITQTTWYRRCARRTGCTNYDAESNWVKKEIKLNTTTTTTATACSTYTWSANSQTYTATGVYTYTSLNAAGCVNTATLNLTINGAGAASISSSNTIPFCNGQSTTLTASSGTSYLWSTGVTTQSITVTPLQSTQYSVTVTSGSSCTSSATKVVYFSSCGVCANNLLVNPSFEQGFGAPTAVQQLLTPPPGWTGGNSEMQAYNASSANPDGTAFGWSTQASPIMYQDVTAVVGSSYNLKFYARSHGTGGTPTIKLQYLNSLNTPIGTASTYTITSGAWTTQQTLTLAAAPSNAAKVRVSANGVTITSGFNPAKLDGVCLTASCSNTTNGSLTATACNSYTWNGTTYTTSGTYTYTSLNATGCVNTATLSLTINYFSTNGDATATACNSYTWNGTTYTTSGTYTYTSLNATGCVNTATLSLTINYSSTNGNATATACNSYTWNGTTYTTSGTYTYTSLNAQGCVNTATLSLTINYSSTNGDATATACNSYTWNGTTYTTSGTYTYTSLNATGCVNTATLSLTINYFSTNGDATATACNSYTWNGTTYTTSGTYTYTSLNATGCVNTATLSLTINYSSTNGDATATACNSYTWNGTTYTTSGIYTYTSLNASGCVNTATLSLTINYSSTNGDATATACSSYTWNGTTYTTSGTYTYTSLNVQGCVNTATLTLTINYISTSTSSTTECDSYTWNGTTYTTSGTYTYTSLNASGCVNTSILNLTINYSSTSTISTTECDSYTWNGITYTTSGTYTYTSLNEVGCLKTEVLNLTINPLPIISISPINPSVCSGLPVTITATGADSYFWMPGSITGASINITPTVTTTYTVTGTTLNGCNSTEVVVVSVNICTVNVLGTVYNDANALTNLNVDGIGIGTPSGIQLYANLIGANGNVVGSVAIAANGTYFITNVPINQNYTMVLSTIQGSIGSPAPTSLIPNDWINTGEDCCDNLGSDGSANGINSVIVGTVDVPNINFGIQQPPTPGTNIQPSQVNPGGNVSVIVPLNAFSGIDPTPGTVVSLTITSFPTNANSITINGITYTSSTFPASGITIPTNGNGVPTQTISVDPINGSVIVTIPYAVTDNGNATSSPTGFVQLPFYPINISGNVFIDNNGPANVDGIGTGTAGTTPLYANLVDATGNVVASVLVNTNGTYNFTDVQPNTTYTMVLSTTLGIVGNPAPNTTLPSTWLNVSEDCCDNSGNDGTTDGTTIVVVGTSDVTNVNFGIREKLSLGNMVWKDVNKNGLKDPSESGIAGVIVNLYNDANNDGTPDGTAIQTMTTLSDGLYIFNNLFVGNYIVGVIPPAPVVGNDFESTTIEEANPNNNIDNNDNGVVKIGAETVSGTVVLSLGAEPTGETPNNGTASDNNSNLTIDFGFYQPIAIAGNVYVDNNGAINVDGTGIGSPSGVQLFANLINSSGTIVGIVPINPNGTFIFTDVQPNSTFTVIVTTTLSLIGNPAPTVSLPIGWSNVSEDCCDNTGNDGITNGSTVVVVNLTDVSDVNFGITQLLSLGNQVWDDINRDGLKGSTELGIVGATVNLYVDANLDGLPDGAAIQTTTSGANGLYIFNGLNQGNYIVGVVPPTGNVYTSSFVGQELNPNLNIDNNDNGIVTIGNETMSGTVALVAGSEPTGEIPNNGNAPDANSNLTIDFGFFICPTGFTFNPILVCAGNTINLIAQEPVGYTGGVWSQGGIPVASTNVTSGTYLYTFQNGTCFATGTLTIGLNIPDYTPTITIAPSAITGVSSIRTIINISEILNRPSCTPLYIFVPRLEPRFSFSYEATATTVGGVAVSNSDWQYFNSNPNFYVWQYVGAATFPASGSSRLGFVGPYDPSQTDGATTFSIQIFQGSGGETNLTNNTDSENLIYFR